jgi:hypothetical protein
MAGDAETKFGEGVTGQGINQLFKLPLCIGRQFARIYFERNIQIDFAFRPDTDATAQSTRPWFRQCVSYVVAVNDIRLLLPDNGTDRAKQRDSDSDQKKCGFHYRVPTELA